jgi:RNA polymerase sigma factor (sigma-70 family)
VVRAAASPVPAERQRAFGSLVEAYWKPVYKYLRLKWRASDEDARDLTQAFFTRAYEKEFFARYDPARARFRTFLRTCLDGFAANERKAESRMKRGGDLAFVPLDFDGAEGELRRQPAAEGLDMEEFFHREWVRSLFALAVDELRRRYNDAGKQRQFAIFARYDLEGPAPGGRTTYAALAEEFGVAPTDVTNWLSSARRDLRAIIMEKLRDLTGNDEELGEEAAALLGLRTT